MTTAKSISETLGLRQGPGLSTQEQQALLNRFPYFALLGALPEGRTPQGFQGTTTLPNPVLMERLRQPHIALPVATGEPDKSENPQPKPQPAEDEAGVLTHLPPSEESSKSVEEAPEETEAGPESNEVSEGPAVAASVAESPEQEEEPAAPIPAEQGNLIVSEADNLEQPEETAAPTQDEQANPIASEAEHPVQEEEPKQETTTQTEQGDQIAPEQTAGPVSASIDEVASQEADSPAPQPAADPSHEHSNMVPAPQFSQDYFRHEGIDVSSELLQKAEKQEEEDEDSQAEQALMVMRSFTEWLVFYRKKSQQEQEEEAAKRSLKAAWQKEKLVAALEEENEEIPQAVFEMAVDSISTKGLVSESLAAIHARQGKFDKARAMYQNLSEQYPEKSSYFAGLIQKLDEAAAART